MKLWLIGALMVAIAATAVPTPADAKRIAGGKSAGVQRNMSQRTAPDAPAAKPATPAQGQQAAPAAAATPGAAPAAAPKRNWLGPIAGLAAGLGIAALLSHFGMGEGFANMLMIALLAAGAFFLIRFLLRRFMPQGGAGMGPQLAGAGASGGPSPPLQRAQPMIDERPGAMQRTADVASATPLAAAAGAAPITRAFVPAAFDSEGFARTAKMIFIRLQAANDTADLDDLKRFTTPEMFATIRLDIQERGATPQHTDVLNVAADVLDVAHEDDRQVVSVRFHGQVIEEKDGKPVDFNEVWHLVKPNDDSRSWAIAGIEQMN
jgi:predicted lipid-binding transport protein (Tim44 family)